MARPGKIFISYRREDAGGDARSIYQRLQRTFGARQLFMDVDTIQKGRDFRKVLDAHLAECQVMLAVIGPHWLDAKFDGGGRRIDDADDFVRIELAAALKRDIPVIPVRVGGARMPRKEELPEDLQPLVFRQAAMLTHENFARDMDGLERDIRELLGRSRRRALAAVVVGLIALVGAGATYQYSDHLREWGWNWGGPETSAAPVAQGDADLNEVEAYLRRKSARPDGVHHIANLSFVDAATKLAMAADDAELINSAVEAGMKTLAAQNAKYVTGRRYFFNAPGHSLAPSRGNAEKLNTIFWDANLSEDTKIAKIYRELMSPSIDGIVSIDGLVSGQFQQRPDGLINLQPFVVFRTQKFGTESRTFSRSEFECVDRRTSKKTLCRKAAEEIQDTIIRLVNLIHRTRIYLSTLPYLDATTKSVLVGGDAELLNSAVYKAMEVLEAAHYLPNNDTNAQKLNAIYWSDSNRGILDNAVPGHERRQKVDRIIRELMEPIGIDGLVTGEVQQKPDGSINLRPFVISRATKNIVTESRTFSQQEFNCTAPNNPKKILCPKAVEDIRDTVIRLLKQL